MAQRIRLILGLFLFFGTGQAFAQSDICCVMGKKAEGSAETMATVMSPSECKSGGSTSGYTVCQARPDPNNECSLLGEKERCAACGYYWSGQTCLPEDPVKKAKAQLKKEEAKKKEAEKKETPEL